jgi:60 kDa SS-A/Ro ribonucleoprotein
LTSPYARHFSTRRTPQSEPIPGSNQVRNNGGGYSFAVDNWVRLDRFLVLGAEAGSYYATERTLTVENARAVQCCLIEDGGRTVRRIVEISEAGRAPKNDPAIFALATAASMGSADTRAAALAALPRVCRIGTHLFQFAENVRAFRGWGRALRRAIGAWYTAREPRELAYQLCKYQQRDGWSHRDLLRLTHPKVEKDSPMGRALAWAVGKLDGTTATADGPLEPILAFEQAKRATDKAEVVRLIREHGLVRECVPTRWLGEAEVWEALLEKMPLTALVRNLATMTRVGLLTPGSAAAGKVVSELANVDRLRKSRLHPVALLVALKTYAAGHGERGRSFWTPVPQVVDALDRAFYQAFANVAATGKRWLLALDVSGSMACSLIAGVPNFSAREASAAMALVTAATETRHTVLGFTGRGFRVTNAPTTTGGWGLVGNQGSGVEPLNISPRQRLDDVVRSISSLPMGPTDCALPMLYALKQKLPVDVFVAYTDSETWHGAIHPVQALWQYRQRTGIPAKLIVVGMVSSGFTIADPDDAGTMDVAGFDTAVPQLMSDFALRPA